MIAWTARLLERYFNLHYDRTTLHLNRLVVTLAAMLFILVSTLIVAFEDIFPAQGGGVALQVGEIAPSNIYAPQTINYTSNVLTEQGREQARAAVRPIYDPPDPAIARGQIELARQVLDFIENVRRDPFGDAEQKARDLRQITAVALSDFTVTQILEMSNETWQDVDSQIIAVLERVMRSEIQESDLARVRARLPAEVSPRFADREVNVVASIVGDLIRANTTQNDEATAAARQAAADAVPAATRGFERGQIVVAGGTRIGAADFEALDQLGLLRPAERRWQGISQAVVASIIVMVMMGLYIARFRPSLIYKETRLLTLLAGIFLLVLLGARLALLGQIYIYPTAVLALLYVAIVGPEIAIIGVIGLAILVGLMAESSLEIAVLVLVGGMIGALTLRRSERLNSFFFAGLMVAVGNMAVVTLFNLSAPLVQNPAELVLLIIYVLLNGLLTAAAAVAGVYIVTLLFNLPTALKLAELSQPNQPLLQRLLREAPGTYQHTLQVANLSEQAANAIGANAELTHVAALYHDVGKMLNPAFFTENQHDIGNPHDALNDPYRSADIIISHVTEGDEIARQYRLPNRLRDFIREHHGTSRVFVFYKQAVILAGDDESLVDAADFSYPGPKPQSRETAIVMLADSCEATIRSRQPKTRQEIEETVRMVIDGKRQDGQLDESGLTLNDLKAIQNIFIEMLQAVFHPRINYTEAISRVRAASGEFKRPSAAQPMEKTRKHEADAVDGGKKSDGVASVSKPPDNTSLVKRQTAEIAAALEDDDDAPMAEVPRLRRNVEPKRESPLNNDAADQNGSGVEERELDSDQSNDPSD